MFLNSRFVINFLCYVLFYSNVEFVASTLTTALL